LPDDPRETESVAFTFTLPSIIVSTSFCGAIHPKLYKRPVNDNTLPVAKE
jgi:hypothetical protein